MSWVFVIINGTKHAQTYMAKVVIKILQSSAVPQPVLGGGLTIYTSVAYFL